MGLRYAVAALLGAALPLAFAPFEAWWLIPLLLAGWFASFQDLPPARAFRVGFVFGASAFTAGTYWLYHSIVTIGNAPLALAVFLVMGMVAIMAFYFGASAALTVRIARGRTGVALIAFPGLFVVLEWLRGWVLSGFPWLSLGYALPESVLAGWLPLGGVYLGSLVLVMLAMALVAVPGRYRRPGLVALVLLAGASVALKDRQYVIPDGEPLSAALAQLGLEQELKWEREQFETTLQWYAGFVRDHAGADVLLTPEVAIPAVAERVPAYLNGLDRVARQSGSHLLIGILRSTDGVGVTNGIVKIGAGTPGGYDKRHLVPFGEFFPVPSFVREWMKLQGLPFSDLERGVADPEPLTIGGQPVASSICYEDAYPSEQLVFFPDARFIVNVTNDAWFGDTIAPHQHLQIARTRSAESQRWQLRAANTGITAIIDSRGRVAAAAPAFEPTVLTGTVQPASGHTPFTRLGNGLPVGLALFLAVAAMVTRRTRSPGSD